MHRQVSKTIQISTITAIAVCLAISLSPALKGQNLTSNKQAHQPLALLTPEENEIAQKLNYEKTVLQLLKTSLAPEFGIIRSGGLETPDLKFLGNINFGPPPLLSKDRDNYLKLAQEHPQLKPIIDYELKFYGKGSKPLEQLEEEQAINRLGKTQYLRDKRLQEALAPFEAIIQQEVRKSIKASTGDKPPAGLLFSIASLKNDEEVDKAIEEVKKKFAGKKLEEINKGRTYLALKLKTDSANQEKLEEKIRELTLKLAALDYAIVLASEKIAEGRQFETREQAQAFLNKYASQRAPGLLFVQKAGTYQAIFPVDSKKDFRRKEDALIIFKQSSPIPFSSETPADLENQIKLLQERLTVKAKNYSPELRLPPGAYVKEISPRHWSVDIPARYSAIREFPTAKVIKLAPDSFGLELVLINETYGFDYNVSHQDIVDKLCDWHKRYGIHVLEATRKSLRICFKHLPENLDAFCKEATQFAPAIGTATEIPGTVTSEMLQQMRETKTLALYW